MFLLILFEYFNRFVYHGDGEFDTCITGTGKLIRFSISFCRMRKKI